MTACSGIIPGSVEIGEDEEAENPEVPTPGWIEAEEKPGQERSPLKVTPTPKPALATGKRKRKSGGIAQGLVGTRKVPVPKPALKIGKRKTRSQGDTEEVSLPKTKRTRGKSGSPPSVGDPRKTQLGEPEGPSSRNRPRPGDQVPIMIVFGRLFGVFARLDSIERVREACTQEKASTPPASNTTVLREEKLKCLIPINP